jgi:hypothetical protein
VRMKIQPYSSVGTLSLNMKEEEVQSQLNESPRFFINDDDVPTEYYEKSGILVYYSDDHVSKAYEFVDNTTPEIDGVRFLKMKSNEAIRTLEQMDSSVIEVADTFISEKLGISLYMLNNKVETLLVFEKGYYYEMFELLSELEND